MPFPSNESAQKWRDNHREQYRETLRRTSRERRKNLKLRIFKLLGNKCANPFNLPHPDWCNDPRCLQIDHVKGGGQSQKPINKQGEMYYKRVLEEIESGSKEHQLLCANCNWIKRWNNKEYLRKTFK